MIDDCTIAVIGAGNMGAGLIHGLVEGGVVSPDRIGAIDVHPEALLPLRQLGVRTSRELHDGVDGSDIVLVAVKPQVMADVLAALAPLLQGDQVVVSVMAGVTTEAIESVLGPAVPVVRAMPQTLVRLQAAATALCAGTHATQLHMDLVASIFDGVGRTVQVREDQMDAVTGLSGSGPAYVYTIIEALTDAGVGVGLPRDVALTLAAQTVLGAGRMVLESGLHPAALRDQVTSPGGTTIAGMRALEEKGLRDALISAVREATARSTELGER